MMDKAVEGALPLYLVQQSAKMPEEQSSHADKPDDAQKMVKQCEVGGGTLVPEYQYYPSTTHPSETAQIYGSTSIQPPVLVSPYLPPPDRDGLQSMVLSTTVLDRLRSVLMQTPPATLPLYTSTNMNEQHTEKCTQAIPYQTDLQTNPSLIVTPKICSSLTIVGADGSNKTLHPAVNEDVMPTGILQITSDMTTIPAACADKALHTEQLPIVELLMDDSGTLCDKTHDNYQVIQVVPVDTGPTYCVECNDSYINGCSDHDSQYNHITDSIIETRARATLPKCLYLMNINRLHQPDSTGVFCGQDLAMKTLFGPLEGLDASNERLENIPDVKNKKWQIFQSGSPVIVLDCSSEDTSNWLMFMKRADTNAEQNLVVYQMGTALYFITNKPIVKDQELMYWYSAEYAHLLGLPKRPDMLLFCNVCREQFVSVDAVKGHKKKMHPNPSAKRHFCCPVCQKAFTSRHKVDIHMAKHTKNKPFLCFHCGKCFTDKSNVKKHMKIHTDEKNYQCLYCAKRFRQKAHLDAHIVIHTGEKRLSCKYCQKKFARPSDLKQHQYIHTNDRNLQCEVCLKVFHRQQNLTKHLKIHSSDRERFPCVHCTKDFPDRYHRNRHSAVCKGVKPPTQIRSETGAELGLSIAKKRIQKRDNQQSQLAKEKAETSSGHS